MLGFQEKYIYTTVPAQVYGSSGSDRSHVFYIDKGAHNGLKPDMAVITADGIVGKVRDVFPYSAQVLAVERSDERRGSDSGNDAHSRDSEAATRPAGWKWWA